MASDCGNGVPYYKLVLTPEYGVRESDNFKYFAFKIICILNTERWIVIMILRLWWFFLSFPPFGPVKIEPIFNYETDFRFYNRIYYFQNQKWKKISSFQTTGNNIKNKLRKNWNFYLSYRFVASAWTTFEEVYIKLTSLNYEIDYLINFYLEN